MKRILLLLILIVSVSTSFAQGTETFTNIPTTTASSYSTRNWTGDNGLAWQATDARTDQTITGAAIGPRVGAVTCNGIPNGIGNLTFKYKQVFSGSGAVIEVRINGTLVSTITGLTMDVVQTATINNINVSGSFNLEIKQTTASLRIAIDDVLWTGYSGVACAAPTTQPTSLLFSGQTIASINGSFTAAVPAADEYLIVRSNTATLNTLPVNGTVYNTDDVLGNGVVVDRKAGTTFTASSLAAGTTYYFFVFALNSNCGGGPIYNVTTPLTGNTSTTSPPTCTVPSAPANALVLTPAATTINGSYTASTTADGYFVVRSLSSTLSASPVNGTSYTVGNAFGGGIVIKFGSGTTFSASGLTISTPYYFFVFAVNNFTCTAGPLYNATALTGTTTTTAGGSGEPVNYYNAATGLNCEPLKTALKTIITTGNNLKTYGDLWNQYTVADIKPREVGPGTSANVIWDIYSDNPTGPDPYNFTPGGSGTAGQCGNYSAEGDCYNREHSFPQNWFTTGTAVGPGTDYHHIFPTDGKVNGMRSNYIYGEVATATYTSQNGSKLGSSSIAGFTGPVFEPINAYKGDLARAFLYMVTRYQDNMPTWGNLSGSNALQALDPSTFPSIDIPYLKLMIKWHNQDPVSQKEIDRNNAAYAYQGNRNPFVDHPEYVDAVWNAACPGLAALPVDIISFGGKLVGKDVVLNWEVAREINFDRYEVERSFNGTDYNKIGEVKALGKYQYTFSDNTDVIRGRRVYYRLKKIDKDGKYSYTEVFSLHIPLNNKFTVYPNPVSNVIRLQMNNNLSTTVTVQVNDMAGKLFINQTTIANNGFVNVPVPTLSNGIYLIKMIVGEEQYVQKVVVVK
jgi:endonuclease I